MPRSQRAKRQCTTLGSLLTRGHLQQRRKDLGIRMVLSVARLQEDYHKHREELRLWSRRSCIFPDGRHLAIAAYNRGSAARSTHRRGALADSEPKWSPQFFSVAFSANSRLLAAADIRFAQPLPRKLQVTSIVRFVVRQKNGDLGDNSFVRMSFSPTADISRA